MVSSDRHILKLIDKKKSVHSNYDRLCEYQVSLIAIARYYILQIEQSFVTTVLAFLIYEFA